jgi:putative transposase
MQRAHKIALDPTVKQAEYFARACGVSRFTWNWGLAKWKDLYEAGEKPSGFGLKKLFNSIRHIDYPWSGEVLRDATAHPFVNLQSAFTNFFKKRARYPRFKRKGVHDSFYIANDRFKVVGNKIQIPKLGWVQMLESLRFNGKFLSAVISRTADRWFCSIVVEIEVTPTIRENQTIVGVDFGVKDLAVLSTGEKISGPKALRKYQEKLARLGRQLSRKRKSSANRLKAKRRLARLYYKISCIRGDATHKLTTKLVREFGTIVLEDLNVAGMVKNHRLARAIYDQGFFEIRRQLEYKAESLGTRIVVADRWYPSSKTCSVCGFVIDILPLSVREWTCPRCGTKHDRDVNAAQNLKQLGVANPEVTPVEMEALVSRSVLTKLPSWKQELSCEYECSQGKQQS